MATTWTIAVDWNRDGTYTDETARVISARWFLGSQQPYRDVANDSQLVMTVRNTDKRFSPENSSGALYGQLMPLRPVKIESDDGTTTRQHYTGWIQTIQPTVNHRGERVAEIICTGAMQFLKSTETKIELQENQRTDEIVDTLIKEVIFPPALSQATVIGHETYGRLGETTYFADVDAYQSFEPGKMTLTMAGDNWVRQGGYADHAKDTFDVYRGIRDVTAAERGKFFFDRKGRAVFWNRHHVLDIDTPDAVFDDTMTGMDYTFASTDQTKNEVIVTCHPRTIASSATTLWELSDSVIRVAAGEKREVYIKYKDENDTRVGAKDVTVEDIEFAQGSVPVQVEAKANGANLIIDNSAGTRQVIVKRCVIKGRKIRDEGQMDVRAIDQPSITHYGRRTMKLNLPSIDNLEQAQYIADFERDRRKTPFGLVQSLNVQSHAKRGGNQHLYQRDLTIGSLIDVQETQTAHSARYLIVGESHELVRGGKQWKTTWYLEKQIATLPGKLDDSLRGQLDHHTVLAY